MVPREQDAYLRPEQGRCALALRGSPWPWGRKCWHCDELGLVPQEGSGHLTPGSRIGQCLRNLGGLWSRVPCWQARPGSRGSGGFWQLGRAKVSGPHVGAGPSGDKAASLSPSLATHSLPYTHFKGKRNQFNKTHIA